MKNPREGLGIVIVILWFVAVLLVIIYLLVSGFLDLEAQSFQNQFDDQMLLCFEGDCAMLDFYPESEGGMVGIASNWMVLIEPDGSAILRHGDPFWHGSVGILDDVVYFRS